MKIQLTKDDLVGARAGSQSCPFYKAIVRTCPNLTDIVSVGTDLTLILESNKMDAKAQIPNPSLMKSWIRGWDKDYTENVFGPVTSKFELISVDLPLEEYCR